MKTFLWFSTLAFAVVCFNSWALSSLAMRSLSDMGRDLLPAFTVALLRPNGWMLVCPLPWIIYAAILSFRRELSSGAVFLFAGTLIFAASVFIRAVVIADVLPWLPMKIGLSK